MEFRDRKIADHLSNSLHYELGLHTSPVPQFADITDELIISRSHDAQEIAYSWHGVVRILVPTLR